MLKKLLLTGLVLSFLANLALFLGKPEIDRTVRYDLSVQTIDNMPIVQSGMYARFVSGPPVAQRSEQYAKWLSTGVRISVRNASGSGTIIYYDEKENYAYVQSCGHLWGGNMTAEEGKRRQVTCTITSWWINGQKRTSPKDYRAEVLYYSNSTGRDISLLRFHPDWQPEYLPIAPIDFVLTEGMRLHSVGCDGGEEVAHYDVRYVGMNGKQYPDVVTTENSPRPGRSGGGLSSEEYYVAICWGTSDYNGTGQGFFTPLKTIREYNQINGFGWLNEVGYAWARMLPIVDRNNPQGVYPRDYIPLPKTR